MSAEATGWVWKNSPYHGSQLLVHLAIADVVNDANDNEFWMSTYKLATKAKVSRSTVTTTLSDMVRDQLLLSLSRGGTSRETSRYRFAMTSAVSGLANPVDNPTPLGQSESSTSAIDDDSLARSARAIPKEITQELKAEDFSQLADPDCFQCHGTGTMYYASVGRDGRCVCTKPRAESAT